MSTTRAAATTGAWRLAGTPTSKPTSREGPVTPQVDIDSAFRRSHSDLDGKCKVSQVETSTVYETPSQVPALVVALT